MRALTLTTIFALLLLLTAHTAVAAPWPIVTNLPDAARQAASEGKVLVVYVTMEGCPYCRKLEKDLLVPAYNRGELGNAYFVELPWDETPILNFTGEQETAAAFIKRYGLSVTPTVLFLGNDGEQLVTALIGYQSADFYWQYLTEAISVASEWID